MEVNTNTTNTCGVGQATQVTNTPLILNDPSEYRPEHQHESKYRDFTMETTPDYVKNTYYNMHTQQTMEFVTKKLKQWSKLDKAEMTIMEAVYMLNSLIDESDPDAAFPNSFHAFQTAEAIRKSHPDKDWFHLVGLIHDLGKVMAIWNEPQWAVVGDTFPVGCKPGPNVVFGMDSFRDNPDVKDPKLGSKLGIYEENCGLDNVTMSWGHDEYFFRVLKANNCTIPEQGLNMIRFHSFYPWHTGGDYEYLCNNKDDEMKVWVTEFNKFDLYSKSPNFPDIEKVTPYYQSLIDKYIPGKLKW